MAGCPELHKGEALRTLGGVSGKIVPVEGGTGEQKNLELPPDAE
jgi:hypothetical protein